MIMVSKCRKYKNQYKCSSQRQDILVYKTCMLDGLFVQENEINLIIIYSFSKLTTYS